MKIKLIKLYSEPQIFNPIEFKDGINIILGQKVENSDSIQFKKNNGVGKSLLIEFLNFCLLKDYSDSRISLIPENFFAEIPEIILDLIINNKFFSIHRKIGEKKDIFIYEENTKNTFESVIDARLFLNKYIEYDNKYQKVPSFREIISTIIRDENTGFNNILISNAGIKNNIPANIKPHLYFFDIKLETYEKIKKIINNLDSINNNLKQIRKSLNCTTTKQINDERAKLNSLNYEVEKMQKAIENFKTMDSFKQIQDEIVEIENKLDILKIQRKVVKSEINKIESIPEYESIDDNEIAMLYNIFKEDLGDKILKSLEQVKKFKNKIDTFQQSIIQKHYESLNCKLESINNKIKNLNDTYSEKMKIISEKGILKDLKTGFKIYDQKNKDLSEKRYKIGEFDRFTDSKEKLNNEYGEELLNLRKILDEKQYIIKSFETTILNIHEYIMGNKEAYFGININKNKDILNFDLRIKADGSFSTNRLKIFIYDLAILFNENTKKNSPNIIIHDNIFQVDNDSLIRCLNLLEKFNSFNEDFQYIFTINRDILDLKEIKAELKLNIDKNRIAYFTKETPFLYKSYTELK